MTPTEWQPLDQREKILVNAGCGPTRGVSRSVLFRDWREVRVDIDPSSQPDIMADITDLSPIGSGFADAVWASHCLEHLFQHQVGLALSEFRRIITDDGFIIFLVPDVQAVASLVAADKFHEAVYDAPAGPVSAHDMFYGYGRAIAAGHTQMAHRCGFTPTILVNAMNEAGFAEYVIRRLPTLELAVLARKTSGTPENNCEALLQALAL